MGRCPDLIMVVRHGARLDAADPTWHLHSPTPYDSPLTLGGWNQSKLLGQRIAAILKAGKYSSGRNGRIRIVMHSSPFLRCLQTSIGIATGIAEASPDGLVGKQQAGSFSRDGLSSITEPHDENDSSEQLVLLPVIEKPLLRVDAFLGEWLSPDYFDHITPPPDTPLMLLSAKAELLAEAMEEDDFIEHQQPPPGYFPGGWSGNGDALTRQRSNSFSQGMHPDGNANQPSFTPTSDVKPPTGHNSSSISALNTSSSDHIPQGHVAQARDVCLEVDMAWDSSKEPLDWGDGGQLGEEWGDLHRRFRRGLKSLMSWYLSGTQDFEYLPLAPLAENDLLVVILVTHSSGCNALIGALTNQPALIDVGQASLTIATKRPDSVDKYDVGMKASTDHLSRKSLTKNMPPKTGEVKAPQSATSARHPRPSNNARRPSQSSQVLPVRTSTSDAQQPQFSGLWGKTTAAGQESSPKMWGMDNSGSGSQPLTPPVLATDIDNEAGAPKIWSEYKAPVKRRWTTNEPNL